MGEEVGRNSARERPICNGGISPAGLGLRKVLHGGSDARPMKKISWTDSLPRIMLAALALCTRAPVSADDGTIIKEASPDRHYEVRKSGNEKNTIEIADLRLRKGDKLLLNFAEIYGLKGRAEDTTALWRSDSGAFAYNYTFLKSGVTVVYRKEGDTFKELELPKLPPMKKEDGKELADTELIITASTIYPIRWEKKSGALVLEEFRIYNGGPWETTYRKIVVNVPAKGPLTLKEVKQIEDSQKPEEVNKR
jgi:hypothetical protein